MSDLAARIAATEKRRRPRGPNEHQKLQDATAAIAGGILRAWRTGCPLAVPQGNEELGDIPGGRPAAQAVQKHLQEAGLIHHQPGVQWSVGFGFIGKATRLWPSMALLDLAAAKGLTPDNIRDAFPAPPSTKPPRPAPPIKVTAIKKVNQKEAPEVPPETIGDALPALQAQVVDWNTFARSVPVTGCRPPQWQRTFKPHVNLGGRWTALENDNYQTMKKEDRALIRIAGEQVAEIDVKATALSIMHGLIGSPLPEQDPYEFPSFPREVIKKWVNCTLGNGKPTKQWPADTDDEIKQHDRAEVGAVIMGRYAFLADPGIHVANTAGLLALSALGKPARLLIHRLQSIEAAAITSAMITIREQCGVLALPVHDSLIVPVSAASAAVTALQDAFMSVANIHVRVTVNHAAAIPEP